MTPSRSARAKLVLEEATINFRDGYRQVIGPIIAEGSVEEMLRAIAEIASEDASKMHLIFDDETQSLNYFEAIELANRLLRDLGKGSPHPIKPK